MDDRQYAFLARQPSAALKTRERFCGMPKRGLAFLLINVMFWQPMWAQADGIVVSAPGTTLGQAGNGVPVVNIAKPNGSGLSHNQFKDYNVGSNGVILNNATNTAQSTQLGGIILGNPNLNGTAAKTILNEVNGGSPSQLRGYTEVAGQSAHVIVANPYGISCNGCGFINTPKATLTTGKPVIENGQLSRYQVDQGSVAIEGAGLNASNVDSFEIITRSAKINAEIQAQNLTIVAGRNDVDAATLNPTVRADDGSAKPELAIDSSALGGMYAGAIKLVGTESGVGVKLDGKMVASGGDIQLDANGHLSMAQTAAAGAVSVNAASLQANGSVYAGTTLTAKTQGNLTSQDNLVARDSIRLDSGGTLSNNGIIEAGVNPDSSRNTTADVTLTAKQLNNNGKTIVASRDLNITTTPALNNQGGTLSGQRKTTVTGNVVDNRNKGRILGNTELHLNAAQVLNSQGGLINSQGLLNANLGRLENNAGELSSLDSATLILGSLDNLTGLVMTGKSLDITATGAIDNQSGELSSQGVVNVRSASLDNRNKGTVAANGKLTVKATGMLNNADNGLIASRNGELKLDAANLGNAKGTLQGRGLVTVDVAGDIDNQGGNIIAQDAKLQVFATNLDNRGGVLSSVKAALEAQVSGVLKNGYDLNRQGGTIQAQGLTIDALAGLFNDGGRIAAQAGDVTLNTARASLDNSNGGLYASGKVKVNAQNLDNSSGQISAKQIDLNLNGTLNNTQGIVEADDSLQILAASLVNQNGQLRTLGQGSNTVFAIGGLFDNSNGTLETVSRDVGFTLGGLNNQSGKLLHTGAGAFGLNLTQLANAGGSLVTYGSLILNADSWTNSTSIQAGQLTVNVNHLTQTATGQLLSTNSFTGRGIDWRNDGLIGSDGLIDVQLTGQYASNGRLSSLGTLGLKAALINLEKDASIAGGAATTLQADNVFSNFGRLTSAAGLSVTAAGIDNHGTLGSAENLSVRTGALRNENGLIFSGADMGLQVDSLTNLDADIYSLGNLRIDRDGLGGFASSIVNSSGSLQSDGNMSLAASTIQNVRTVLTTNDAGIYTASIREVACIEGVNAGDCSGGKENHVWQIIQRDKFEVTAASAASSITSGGNLNIQAGDLTNRSSSIGAGGALTANLVSLNNIGIETSDTETSRTFMSERTRSPGGWRTAASNFTNKYWFQSPGYNANDLGGLEAAMSRFIGTTERELPQFGSSRALSSDTQTYAAIIQSGGAVDIRTQGTANNGVVRGGYHYVGAGPRTDTGADGKFSTLVTVNRQLPPDLAQQQVNPVTLPGFVLPTGQNGLFRMNEGTAAPTQSTGLSQVRGLPDRSFQANPQKYLIETNPALTDMRRFMSSDYLLSNLGYDPDIAAKRLGDGFYEQRLIQQAVIARTGQRFLDGQTSDEGMFKYLMNNAIASKDTLNLALGVSLTGEQVAALTHDIVWMETQTVNNQQVLVPVLYLANANHRLAANGALIQGSDVSLIAGKNLDNAGTLRASSNLTARANDSLVNSGLLEAGNRLDALASNNLTNRAGGVMAGRDVSVVAVAGDVTNERTVTTHESSSGYRSERSDFIDSAARIEAANSLSIGAGNDINNIGGVLKSGADTHLDAGRDINLVSAEGVNSGTRGRHRDQDIKQYGSSLDVGRDLTANAGRNLAVVASQIDVKRDVAMAAKENLSFVSAADEQHSYSKTKKVTRQEDHVSQVASTVTAGGNVVLSAGQDLAMISSKVNAANEAYLVAGGKLELLAAQDSDYSLYDMKKKGGWGSKKTQRDEVTDVKNIGSEITTGGDLRLVSGSDQRYQVAKLQSGKDITLDSGGSITFEGVKDLHQESHEKSNNNAFWVSSKGKGKTDETLRQSQLIAEGSVAIKAVDGLKIDVNQINQQTVSQSIDAMVKADPQLAWLKEAEKRGDVDWRQVKEIHDSFKYSHSGLGPASQIIIAIVMAAVVGPMAAGAMGGATGGMVAAGTITAETAAGISAAAGAVAAGAATTATVSTINNRGNLGAVFKDVTSSDAIKGYAIAGATAGLTAAYFDGWTGTETSTATEKVVTSSPLSTWSGVGQFAANQGLQNGTSMLLSKALGQDASAGDALKNALFNTLAAASFNMVGDYTKNVFADGSTPKIAIHAMVGGLLAEATGGDFKTGALAAGANEALVAHLNTLVKGNDNLLTMSSQIVGVVAAAAQEDTDAAKLEKGSWIAKNATQYNHSLHEMQTVALDEQRRRNPDSKARLDAAACALTHCSRSVPESDKHYDDLLKLEQLGQGFTEELALLKSTGQFEYSFKDRVDDTLAAHEELIDNLGWTANAAFGAGAGTLSYVGMVGSAPACVSVVGCAAPFALGSMGTVAFAGAAESFDQVNAPYTSMEGERVLASFDPAQYPGETSAAGDLGYRAAQSLAELLAAHVGGKALSGELSSALKGGGVGAKAASGTDDLLSVPKASDGTVVVRSDNDFSLSIGGNGKPKAYITEEGDLMPPNLEGTGSIQTHVRGGGSENSPYISVTDPRIASNPKDYGSQQIEIDVKRLQEDIDSGLLPNTRFLSNREVTVELQAKINAAREKYTNNPSEKNQTSLNRAEADLVNVMRDGECLIKGCVPATYLKFIRK